jgi:integrase
MLSEKFKVKLGTTSGTNLESMKNNLSLGVQYTDPKISTSDPKDWFIYFRYTHEGKPHLKKYREGINRIKDKSQRIVEAQKLCHERLEWLKMGWNPVIDPEYLLRRISSRKGIKEMFLNEALDWALSKKSIKGSSKDDYRCILAFLKETATRIGFSLLPISQVDRTICLELVDECAKDRGFSNNNYNKYISCLRSMLSELLNYRLISVNPLLDFRDRVVPESNKCAAYTEEEKQAIELHLSKVHPQLFVVMSVVYHTGIRPQEALELQVKDIDMKEGIITIAQEAGNLEKSKTSNVRRVPINPHLYEQLRGMQMDQYPGNYFVFGTPFPRGGRYGQRVNGKMLVGAMHPATFTPNPYHVKRDTLTKLWKKLVMDPPPTGLSIRKYLYAAKHTGTDDKVDEGLDLKEVQIMYGHSSEAMTARYNKRKRENAAKSEILAKSPKFSK